ncbi:MAG: hypothetical protein ACKOZW_02070 [Cyanobium sp.]
MRGAGSPLAALLAGLILLPSAPLAASGSVSPAVPAEGAMAQWIARGGGGRGGGGHGGGARAGGGSRGGGGGQRSGGGGSRAHSGFQGSGSSFSRGDRRPQGGFSQGNRTSRVGNPSLDRPSRPSRPAGLADRPGGRPDGLRPDGNRPRPDRPMADRSPGDRSLGDRNLGDRTLGDRNLGDRNLRDRNLGDRQLGERNLGDRTLGDRTIAIDRDWNRNINIGDIDLNPGWARAGWGVARPWNWGWYGGWSNPPWGWWGARAAAWGVGTLATAAIINAEVDDAVADNQTTIIVPNTEYRLLYGTVEPGSGTTITFVVQAAGADYQLSADCQRGLINNREPASAQEAELLNAACQVAFGTAS